MLMMCVEQNPLKSLTKLKKTELLKKEKENLINFFEPPSLKYITSVSIAIQLWTRRDMLDKVKNFYDDKLAPCTRKEKRWMLNEMVYDRLSELSLPGGLYFEIEQVIRHIGVQLYKSFKKMDHSYLIVRNGGSLCWTGEGVIDQPRSLKTAIDNIHVKKDYVDMFKIACRNCSEENIFNLWSNLTYEEKIILEIDIHRKGNVVNKFIKKLDHHLWSYWMAQQSSHLSCFFKYNTAYEEYSPQANMFLSSLFDANVLGVKYFWKKLAINERQNLKPWLFYVIKKLREVNFKYLHYNEYTDILCFLLPYYNESDQLKDIFKTNSNLILKALFYSWPFQRLFLPTIKVMFEYLHEGVYVDIMKCIVREIKEGRTTNYFFRDVLRVSPLHLREYFLSDLRDMSEIIWKLLISNDLTTAELLLSGFSSEQKSNICLNMINVKYESYVSNIIEDKKLSSLNALLSRTMPLNGEIFKQGMIFIFGGLEFTKLTCAGNLSAAQAFLYWGSQCQNIKNINANETIINVDEIIFSFILQGDYQKLDQFLNWCYEEEYERRSKVRQFLSKDVDRLLDNLRKSPEYSWIKFEAFFEFGSFSVEETSNIKKLFLNGIHIPLQKLFLKFSTWLLNWCCDSADELKIFKEEYLLSEKGINVLVGNETDDHSFSSKTKILLRWFYLNAKVVVSLKELLNKRVSACKTECSCKVHKDCQTLLHILDSYEFL